MSPISSRNSVPPEASSNLPARASWASVNAPFSCPNSSLSSSVSVSGRAIHGDERMFPPSAAEVNQPGDDFFARAILAQDAARPGRCRRFVGPSRERLGSPGFRRRASYPARLARPFFRGARATPKSAACFRARRRHRTANSMRPRWSSAVNAPSRLLSTSNAPNRSPCGETSGTHRIVLVR